MGRKNKSKNSDYLLQGSILAAAGIIVRIIGLLYRVPVTNILGEEGNGYYTQTYSIYNILLMVSSFGLPLAVSKLVSTQMVLGHKRNALKIFKSAVIFALAVGGVIGTITFIFSQQFANILASPPSAYALRVIGPTLFVMAILGAIRGYFQGLGTMVPTAFSQIFEGIVNAVVSVVAANIFYNIGYKKGVETGNASLAPAFGAAGSTIGTLSGAITALIFLLFILYAYKRIIKRQIRRDRTGYEDSYQIIMKSLLITIVPVVLSTVTYNISELLDSGIFNNIMKFKGYSTSEYSALIGAFSKAKVLSNVPLTIASCLTPSMIPSLSEAMVSKNKKLAKDKVHMSIRYTMVITIPCAIGLGVLASPIMQLLYPGDDPTLAANLLRIVCFTLVFYAYSTIENGILQGIDKLKVPVINAVIALGVHLCSLLVFLLIFDMGIYAVALSDLIFAVIMCFLNTRSIMLHLHYRQEMQKTFLTPGICSGIMGVVVYGVYKLFMMTTGINAISALFAVVIGVIVYAITLLKFRGITENELLGLPKGQLIVNTAAKLHLL